MMNYEEKIKQAKETGKGIATRFQEAVNFTMAKEWKCPHCGSMDEESKSKPYEIAEDIKWMCENGGYSWHEDVKCKDCRQMYTQNNGC